MVVIRGYIFPLNCSYTLNGAKKGFILRLVLVVIAIATVDRQTNFYDFQNYFYTLLEISINFFILGVIVVIFTNRPLYNSFQIMKTDNGSLKNLEQATTIHKRRFDQLTNNWSRTPTNDLPSLFMGFNGQTSQRIVSYSISMEEMVALLYLDDTSRNYNCSSENAAQFRLKLYMGTELANPNRIEDIPPFTPIIQGISIVNQKEESSIAFEMEADYSAEIKCNPTKPVVRIPRPAAILFVVGWNELSNERLSAAFEGVSQDKFQRVKSYIFDCNDSLSIRNFVKANEEVVVKFYLHLGVLPVPSSEFPYEFHPVIEVRAGLSSEFFEYSSPCPPACEI